MLVDLNNTIIVFYKTILKMIGKLSKKKKNLLGVEVSKGPSNTKHWDMSAISWENFG